MYLFWKVDPNHTLSFVFYTSTYEGLIILRYKWMELTAESVGNI